VATTQTYTLSNEFIQIFRRQQDNLPEHVKVNVYFNDQGPGHPDTGYYLDTPRKQHAPLEFIKANSTYHWVKLLWREDKWQTNQRGIYNGSDIGWWIISDPQHPNHIFYEQEASVPLTIAAVTTALQQLPTCPNTPDYPTAMEGQQEEINVATGQAQQEAQRINVITNSSNGALKGNPPPIFDGDRNKARKFLLSWNLWAAINQNNDTMKKPFSRIVTMLSYMDGTRVDAWKEEQLDKIKEEADEGIQETDETLWDNFIERFKEAFENQNHRSEAYQESCKLKQGDSLDDFFTKFKQLAHEAGVPLDDKGTIETLKHAMTQGLTSAIIHSPPLILPLKSPGLSKNGKNRPANPISNGRQQPSSPKDVRDFSKHSNLPLGRSTTQEKAVTEGTTTGGTKTIDAPPLKEDIIWTSTLQSLPTLTLPLAEDNSTLKPRKRNS